MTFYECPECGRAYTEAGFSEFCHPESTLQEISVEVVESAMSRRKTERDRIRAEENPKPKEAELDIEALTDWGDKVVTHASGAKRASGDKIRWDLMPIAPMRDTAMIWTFGAAKYGSRNWEQGFDWSGPYASLQRHLQAWFAGEDFDQESGMSHLAHAACNIQMLQQFEYTHTEGDDRPIGTAPPPRKANEQAQESPTPEDPNPKAGLPRPTPTRW